MSNNLKPVAPQVNRIDSEVQLTQYCGPVRADSGDRRRLQLTQSLPGHGAQFLWVSREQALLLAAALVEWVAEAREESEK